MTKVEDFAGEPVERRALPDSGGFSAFSWLLVAIPLAAVFLLLDRYWIAAAILATAAVWAVRGRESKNRNYAPLAVFTVAGGVLVFFIVLPILNLLFTTDPSRIASTARDPAVQAALSITLSAALIATLISLLFGVPLGYVLAREKFAGKALVEGIVDMPVVIPHTIAGIALLFIFGRGGILGAPLNAHFNILLSDTYWGIVLAMLFVGLPFIVNHCRDGFLKVDPRIEYVARSLGATYLQAFFRVTIPLTWRALLSGAIMTWARAISEFGSVAIIAYYPKTINTLLFEWYNFFGYTYTKPLSALLLLIALAIFISLRAVATLRRAEH
ncbi:MAG: ABC transporter permease [Acidobacteriia bacterium]|nr:ABC transporter permease [Terriglobia bacterium]